MTTTKTETHYASPLHMATRGLLTDDELGMATLGRVYETEVLVFDDKPAAALVRYRHAGHTPGTFRAARDAIEIDVSILRKRIRRLAFELHPDRNADLPEEEQKRRTAVLSDATMLLKKLEEQSLDVGQKPNSSILLVEDPNRVLADSIDRLSETIARVLDKPADEPEERVSLEGEIELDPIEIPSFMPRMRKAPVQPTAMTGRQVSRGYAAVPWERGVLVGSAMLGAAVWLERRMAVKA